MNGDLLTVFAVLAMAVVLFASSRVRNDVVALLVLLALMSSGVLTVDESLAGFSDPVVLVIAAMFVVGEAMVHTGISQTLGEAVVAASRGSETRLIVLLMLVVGGVGAFMSSTAVVSLFIPVTLTIATRAELNRKRLLMPLAAASLISGMMTLIATAPNLIVANALKERGIAPLGFFSFTPFGLASLAVGILFMLIWGRRMLARESHADAGPRRQTIADLVETYGLSTQLSRLRVLPDSPLVGQSVAMSQFSQRFGVNLMGIERTEHGKRIFLPAHADSILAAGDAVFVVGDMILVNELAATQNLLELPPLKERGQKAAAHDMGLAEIILPPGSRSIGRTLREIQFRSRYSVTVLGVRRRGKPVTAGVGELRLDFGDVLLVSGSWPEILRLREEHDCFVVLTLPDEYRSIAPARRKVPAALIILGCMVVSMAFGFLPNVASAMLAAVALVTCGCVRLDAVYRVIGWQAVVLVAGILPLATAINKSGAMELISTGLVQVLGHLGPMAVLCVVFLLTSVTGLFISNSATAVIVSPLAINLAIAIGVSPHAFAMTVAIACSAAYATPVSSPVNTLVMDPGGYTFMDFVKVGLPLQMLTLMVTVVLAWMIYLR